MDTEEWRDIAGWEGWYQASTHGRVRLIQQPVHGHGRLFKEAYPIVLVPLLYQKGYFKQHLSTCNNTRPMKRLFLHRLIWSTFHGPIPEGMTVNHIDGIKSNNRLDNLELATIRQQTDHARKMGLSKNANGKVNHLTADDVRTIRSLYAAGNHTMQDLGERFNTTFSNIRWIVIRRTWRHVA